MKKFRLLFLLSLFSAFGFSWPFTFLFSASNNNPLGSSAWVQREMQIFRPQANIDERALRYGLIAYMRAKQRGQVVRPYLTIIDYSKPSNQKRLFVLDMQHGRTLFDTWVSHGKNSGGLFPTTFSNSLGSLKSSLGVFVTNQSYEGKNGYSLRLTGLERGINDNAYRRSVVIHGAWYVNPDTIRRYGQAGKSWGCPAVSAALAKPIINTIKDHSVVVAYYPDRNWLAHSRYLS
jgi:hypothetical protein